MRCHPEEAQRPKDLVPEIEPSPSKILRFAQDDKQPLDGTPPPCNLSPRPPIQYLAKTRTRPGPVTLRRDLSPKSDSDAVDATLAASGDAHAFERLYRAHVGRVHSLARRMLGDDDADEAAQDVFVRAWEKLGTFRGEAAFGTWLHRLAINVMLGRRERRGVQRQRYLEGEGMLEAVPGRRSAPETSMDMETAIARLPDGARQIFVLHDVEGYRHEEIAEMLGLATGTSKSQLHRARMALRQHLDR
jgi:RNA polymerase sigma-70 factor, ECF subfamily